MLWKSKRKFTRKLQKRKSKLTQQPRNAAAAATSEKTTRRTSASAGATARKHRTRGCCIWMDRGHGLWPTGQGPPHLTQPATYESVYIYVYTYTLIYDIQCIAHVQYYTTLIWGDHDGYWILFFHVHHHPEFDHHFIYPWVSFIHLGFSTNDLFKRDVPFSLPKMVKFGLAKTKAKNCWVPN